MHSASISSPTPQRSAWLRTACAAPATGRMEGDPGAPYVIVGGGYTGLNAAIRLAELGHECIVLESCELGFGASGRNGGQVIPGLKHDPAELVRRLGERRGDRLARFAGDAATRTFDLIRRHALSCEAQSGGWLQPAVDQQTLERVEARSRMWREFAGVETVLLDRTATRSATGTDFYIGGWIDPRGGQIQPLSYARELARVAIGLGARIFTHSPVSSLRRVSGQWLVTSRGFAIRADRVILCTGGYSGSLLPGLDRAAIPASSIICSTVPLPDTLRRQIMPAGLPISDARRLLAYMRYDSEGRFMIGARGSFGLHEPESDFVRLRAAAIGIFPQLAQVQWEDAWGGRFALTVDHLPHLHQPEEGLFTAIGCNGRGVAMMSQVGRVLAELACREMAAEDCPVPVTQLRTIPFHAFRRPGLEAVALWYRFRDRFSLSANRPADTDTSATQFMPPPFGG